MSRDSRNSAFHELLDEPWEGAGKAMLAHAQERGVPLFNMQMQPRHGVSGKSVPKTVGELESARGQGHVVGSGLATGRVSKRLRTQSEGGDFVVRPSMRAHMLGDTEDTAREHDFSPGKKMVVAPEHIEDMEVRQAGLPPLRSTSRGGFMPGLGSVAMHKQEARVHEDRLVGLKRDHRAATRRLKTAVASGNAPAIAEHGNTVGTLTNQIKESKGLAEHHHGEARKIADAKIEALTMMKGRSGLRGENFSGNVMASHAEHFDPGTEEEFYPVASQHQLRDVADVGGVTQTQATNLTAMTSAQRQWRRVNAAGEVSHPNLAIAAHIATHFTGLHNSGQLAAAEQTFRATAQDDIIAGRREATAQLDAKRPRKDGPRSYSTEITPDDVEKHVKGRLVDHVARNIPTPGGGMMPPSQSHLRQAAKLLLAKSPQEMADVWSETDADKRPTFALALAAAHPNQSVRRQSLQAVTVDTHHSKMADVDYHDVLGTGPGMHSSARQEIPHQPGRQVQPAYNVLAMLGSRMALRETAKNVKVGERAVSPRYAQENPWGLFAAENMGDVAAARKAKAAGGSRVIRKRASGYYRGQGGDEDVRSFKVPTAHPMAGRQFTDEELFS